MSPSIKSNTNNNDHSIGNYQVSITLIIAQRMQTKFRNTRTTTTAITGEDRQGEGPSTTNHVSFSERGKTLALTKGMRLVPS